MSKSYLLKRTNRFWSIVISWIDFDSTTDEGPWMAIIRATAMAAKEVTFNIVFEIELVLWHSYEIKLVSTTSIGE